MSISRRTFLTGSAALVAGTMAHGRVLGANDRIQVAIVGLNGQGGYHLEECLKRDDVDVVALCDVDGRVLDRRIAQARRESGSAPFGYRDIRDLLADQKIDAITIAMPNHWHTLAAIWACQAGKDVYVEKPLSHEVWEGRQLVTAAAQTQCIVQHGTQRRSESRWIQDIRLMHEGIIGDLTMARALCFKTSRRESIGVREPDDPPEHLDWPLWQGPAQEQPFCGNYVHYNWHWFWAYGNGEIGNQGVHQMDVAVWGLGKGLPIRVHSTGGRYAWNDQGETPNTQIASFTYADGATLVFEVRNLGSYEEAGLTVGNTFFGTEGYYIEGQGFFNRKGKPIRTKEKLPPAEGRFDRFFSGGALARPG